MISDPRVLVDARSRDDAAVFQIAPDRAIVASLDFFTPIVDDPYIFGVIAAANAFSDLYAMGATPFFALSIVGWPRNPEILEMLSETIRGGVDVATEAGAFVLGGHSIDDIEPKFGMVTIGEVHPSKIKMISGACPGDALILTKPLGTGILSTALKRDLILESDMATAIRSMSTLNASAAAAVALFGESVHSVTDVTGFGLLGHLHNMMRSAKQSARIMSVEIPAFEGVRELIDRDVVPGGTRRNLEEANKHCKWSDNVPACDRILFADAQTSGGLLIAVSAGQADNLLAELKVSGVSVARIIGEVIGPIQEAIEII